MEFQDDDYLCYQNLVYLHFLVYPLEVSSFEEEILTQSEFKDHPHFPDAYRQESPVLSQNTEKMWFISTQSFKHGGTILPNRRNRANNPATHFDFIDFVLRKYARPAQALLLGKEAKKRFKTYFELYYHLDVRHYPTGPWISATELKIVKKYHGELGIYTKYVKAPAEEPA